MDIYDQEDFDVQLVGKGQWQQFIKGLKKETWAGCWQIEEAMSGEKQIKWVNYNFYGMH